MRRMMRGIAGATAAAILVLMAGTPAHADPSHAKHGLGLQIGCDNGHAYAAVTNGKGRFVPAHDVSSHKVLVPVAFSKALVTVLDSNLNVVDQWTTPAAAKKGEIRHHRKALVTCDVVGFAQRADGNTITVQESMAAYITPGR
jgi:hypothetical protein